MSVKTAAERLGVGRPALSNLLNAKAALSLEMAMRFEKAFGADHKDLLSRQAQFDQTEAAPLASQMAIPAYVPSFLKITAKQIESWVDRAIEPRALLAVLLRKLVHSTGQGLTVVDFPGYDNAQRRGWDGQIRAEAPTPWIPSGHSGWEFGCDDKPKVKAESDYKTRLKAVPAEERAELTFVFVTPRRWEGIKKWAKDKNALGQWKAVRAYDASDLEQWLEQSIPAQGWLAEQIGVPAKGVLSLEEHWRHWASATKPPLARDIFEVSIKAHKQKIISWLDNPPSTPLIVSADSRDEAAAFLSCVFEEKDLAKYRVKDRALLFASPDALQPLLATSAGFLPILLTEEAAQAIGGFHKHLHTILVRPRNMAYGQGGIALDLMGSQAFEDALKRMNIDRDRIHQLARESAYSPTILRRRLSDNPAIKTPAWSREPSAVQDLIPMAFAGAWNAGSKADREVLGFLAGRPYEDLEKQITELLRYDDPPVWSVAEHRGVASKIDALFAIAGSLTRTHIENFFVAAALVLSETDPALQLPEDTRSAAGIYGKTRDHSNVLRGALCETLTILAVHGDALLRGRLNVNLESEVNSLVGRLLTPLIPENLFSQSDKLPLYAEAAPQTFLDILEKDLSSSSPQVYSLMRPAGGPFGGCPRAGLLWALETLAWKPEQLSRVCDILARLAALGVKDNWTNKPENSLLAIFRAWMPQTAASLEQRKKALRFLISRSPTLGWQICIDQFKPGTQIGHYNHRPRWRSDASGSGQPAHTIDAQDFAREAFALALSWPSHDENTLSELVRSLQGLSEEYQLKVWDLIDGWAAAGQEDGRKHLLRECIRQFAFTRRGRRGGFHTKLRQRAHEAYARLTPDDVVIRHLWLFGSHWVEPSFEEIEGRKLDYEKREEHIRALRVQALKEIWKEETVAGIIRLMSLSAAGPTIGHLLREEIVESGAAADVLERCLNAEDPLVEARVNELVAGFLYGMKLGDRLEVTDRLAGSVSSEGLIRLLKSSPFGSETWKYVDRLEPKLRARYWQEVYSSWPRNDEEYSNELIDRLLEAKRPRAAFEAIRYTLEKVETSRLKRLLHEIATSRSEPQGSFPLHEYHVSAALDQLQTRSEVTEAEMAQIEFQFLDVLKYGKRGTPNLERQIAESPGLFMQLLALAYKRRDSRKDPQEWVIADEDQRAVIAEACFTILQNMKYLPGTSSSGVIDKDTLKSWILDVRSLCAKHGRQEVGDIALGQILASAPPGEDGIWPCVPVREVLETTPSPEIGQGLRTGVYNSRGAHWRGEGGDQERAIAEQYRGWSRHLAFESPFLAKLLGEIAEGYERDATREDLSAALQRRLPH